MKKKSSTNTEDKKISFEEDLSQTSKMLLDETQTVGGMNSGREMPTQNFIGCSINQYHINSLQPNLVDASNFTSFRNAPIMDDKQENELDRSESSDEH